jgi:hypothetical protein
MPFNTAFTPDSFAFSSCANEYPGVILQFPENGEICFATLDA